MEHLFVSETAPFVVALMVMFLFALIEFAGMFFGVALSGLIDSVLPDLDLPDVDLPDAEIDLDADLGVDADFDLDADVDMDADVSASVSAGPGPFAQFLGWLSFGKVPALILFMAFLTAFGLSGILVQGAVHNWLGFYLPAPLAAVPALIIAMPSTRYAGRILASIIPKEETEAVSRQVFLNQTATITLGTAKRGLPAEAKLRDKHGQVHYVHVEPDLDGIEFNKGDDVLIVRQIGNTYRVIAKRSDPPQEASSDATV